MSAHANISEIVKYTRSTGEESTGLHALKPFLRKAGWITRSISPFVDLDYALSPDDESTPDDLAIRTMVLDLHPQFHDLLEAFSNEDEDSDAYMSFLALMTERMNAARACDTNAFKYTILGYLSPNPYTPIAVKNHKDYRGWNHKWTARALCPLKHLDKFDADPIPFMKTVQSGAVKIIAKELPSFLFPDDAEYNPENPDDGLFRSPVMIKGLRLIYTGSSSTENGVRAQTKPSQAEMHGMRSVTPRHVAYTACQIYFALSSSPNWEPKIGYFKLEKFFKIILGLFRDDPADVWSAETLRYLTNELPSLKRVTKRRHGDVSDSEDDSDDDDPTGNLRARAAAREAEREQRRDDLAAEERLEQERRAATAAPSDAPVTPPSTSPPRANARHALPVRTPVNTGAAGAAYANESPLTPLDTRRNHSDEDIHEAGKQAPAGRGRGRGRGQGRGNAKKSRGRAGRG